MEVDTHPFQKLDINMVSYEYLATKRKKMKQVWQPKKEGKQETKGSIEGTSVFERLQSSSSTRGIWAPHQIRQSVLNRLEHQIKYTSNGITYQVTGHTLVDNATSHEKEGRIHEA